MQYSEIQIEIDSSDVAALRALLCTRQLSFQEADQTTLDAPPPGRTRIHLFVPLDERGGIPDLLAAVRATVPVVKNAGGEILIEVRDRDESEWRDVWKRFFATRRIGRVAIVPSWESEQHAPGTEEVTLHLDPGRAFGTGGHESTRMCLRFLDQLHGQLQGQLHEQLQEQPLGQREEQAQSQASPWPEPSACSPLFSVVARRLAESANSVSAAQILDVGCGSGVLAIAALRMWPQVLAVAIDVDPEAIEVTLENADRNGVKDRLRCETTALSALPPKDRFGLVLANLTGPTLCELAAGLSERLAEGGVLVLSGILEAEVGGVAAHFAGQGLIETARATEDEWAALQYVRPATETERGLRMDELGREALA
jgi:ribosomal protein L11 methyltransferase